MYTTQHATEVFCTSCRSIIAKQGGGMLQIKAGKIYVHTSSTASVGCWKCDTNNLITMAGDESGDS